MEPISIHVLRFTQPRRGQMQSLYEGVMDAHDLIDRTTIPQWDTETGEGYQRRLEDRRPARIASYVLDPEKEQIMPTSILVNIREGGKYEPIDEHQGTLTIPIGECLQLMDGQHRMRGLELARKKDAGLRYDVPVVFTLGDSVEQEAGVFLVVNREQKAVSVDLVLELIAKKTSNNFADPTKAAGDKELKQTAAVEIINSMLKDPECPWYNRIQLAEEGRSKDKPIRKSAFANSLSSFLSGDWASRHVKNRSYGQMAMVTTHYWQAIRQLMPVAFDDFRNHTVMHPTGAFTFGYLMRDFVHYADKHNNFSVKFFAKALEPLEEWVEAATWREDNDE